jgi:hypothetical protein
VATGIAGFEDALARREVADFDLSGEYSGLIIIEEFEKRDVAEFFGIAGHGGFSQFSGRARGGAAKIAEKGEPLVIVSACGGIGGSLPVD